MQCVSVFLSDGDPQIINSINQLITNGLLNLLTKCRGCYCHGVSQVLLKLFSKDNKKASMVRNVIGSFMNLCGKSQTENELKHY